MPNLFNKDPNEPVIPPSHSKLPSSNDYGINSHNAGLPEAESGPISNFFKSLFKRPSKKATSENNLNYVHPTNPDNLPSTIEVDTNNLTPHNPSISSDSNLPSNLPKQNDLQVYKLQKKGAIIFSAIISFFILFAVIGVLIEENNVKNNNNGLASLDNGDFSGAEQQFQDALNGAQSDELKYVAASNLAYLYASDSKYSQALDKFKEARSYTGADTFEYNLMTAEIALLEYRYSEANIYYQKAYTQEPNSFQANNALNLFYLDLDGRYHDYVDYAKALEHAKQAYAHGSDSPNIAQQNLAIAHYFNDNYQQTIDLMSDYDTASQPEVAIWLGYSYYGLGDYDNALKYLETAQINGYDVQADIDAIKLEQ